MRVYAGVYNRDYGEYKRGVDQYERYTCADLRNEETALAQGGRYARFIAIEDNKIAVEHGIHGGIPADELIQLSPDAHREMYQRKLARYKGLYNELPRGYFRSS